MICSFLINIDSSSVRFHREYLITFRCSTPKITIGIFPYIIFPYNIADLRFKRYSDANKQIFYAEISKEHNSAFLISKNNNIYRVKLSNI